MSMLTLARRRGGIFRWLYLLMPPWAFWSLLTVSVGLGIWGWIANQD